MRRAALLVLLGAAWLAWPGGAQAATCTSNDSGDTLTVVLGVKENATISRSLAQGFRVNGVLCVPTKGPVQTVVVTGDGSDQGLTLQLPLQFSSVAHVDFHVDLGAGSDRVTVTGTAAADHVVVGDTGINFDADTDSALDVSALTGVESFWLDGKAGNDTLSGAGGFLAGFVTSLPITFLDRAGLDTAVGGSGRRHLYLLGGSLSVRGRFLRRWRRL